MNFKKKVVFRTGLLPASVSEICAVIGGHTELIGIASDAEITCFAFCGSFKPLHKNCLCIRGRLDVDTVKDVQNGGIAALTDHPIEGIPCILVEDLKTAQYRISNWMYEKISLPSVVVTGSVGKTTTKRMINRIMSKRDIVFTTNKNRNMLAELCCYLQNVKGNETLVVWEVAENLLKDAMFSAQVLKPEIAVITNIGDSHLGAMENGKETLYSAVLSITQGMSENGTVIINADDSDSALIELDRPTVRVGIYDPSADCFAFNLCNTRKGTEFDIRFHDEITHMKLSVFGEHNVYNALMAFVAGILRGIDRKDVVEALRGYRNVGIRQNLLRIGKTVIYADFYNASSKSISYALRCFCEIPELHGKRIAVLGDIAEIEGYEESSYRKVAKAVDQSSIDVLVTYGNKSSAIHDYLTREIEKHHCATSEELNCCLEKLKQCGKNAYLLKASRSMKLENNMKVVFPLHYRYMKFIEKLTFKYLWRE